MGLSSAFRSGIIASEELWAAAFRCHDIEKTDDFSGGDAGGDKDSIRF
jgi:hypothetical protein